MFSSQLFDNLIDSGLDPEQCTTFNAGTGFFLVQHNFYVLKAEAKEEAEEEAAAAVLLEGGEGGGGGAGGVAKPKV